MTEARLFKMGAVMADVTHLWKTHPKLSRRIGIEIAAGNLRHWR